MFQLLIYFVVILYVEKNKQEKCSNLLLAKLNRNDLGRIFLCEVLVSFLFDDNAAPISIFLSTFPSSISI